MKIAIGNDHVATELKNCVKEYIEKKYDFEVIDCGTNSDKRTDYPIYGKKVAQLINENKADAGILICGTGVGITITANKIKGIRAVVCSEPYSARLSKEHNNTNVLGFGSKVVGTGLALQIVDAWLEAEYEGGRHEKRIQMLDSL